MSKLWGREPAMVLAFVMAVVALAVTFGLSLPDGAEASIEAAVALLLGLVTRSQVSPARTEG